MKAANVTMARSENATLRKLARMTKTSAVTSVTTMRIYSIRVEMGLESETGGWSELPMSKTTKKATKSENESSRTIARTE